MNNPYKKWFINQSLSHPRRSIFIGILITVILGSGVSWFVVDDDIMKMLPKDLESKITWDAVKEEFGSTDRMFIAFGNSDQSALTTALLADLWDFTKDLESLPVVEEVISIANSNRMDSEDGFLEISDLQPSRIMSESEIIDIKSYLDENSDLKSRFVSKQGDFINVVIRPIDDVSADIFVAQIMEVADQYLTEYETHYGGQIYITGVIPPLIRNDVASLMRAGIIIMVLILLGSIRSIPAVGMILVVIVFSLVSMIGFMGWMLKLTGSNKFLFSVMNTSMPIILLTIANSDGVHLITKFFKKMRETGDKKKAVEATLDSLLLPIFLTSLTTIAAFSSMVFAPIEQLFGYGISISVGIACAWYLTSTFMPSMIILKKWKMNSKAMTHASYIEKGVHVIGNSISRHPKRILGTGLIIVVIGLGGISMLNIEVNILKFFKEGSPIRSSIVFLDNEMTGTLDLQLRIEEDIKEPAVLKNMEIIQNYLEENEAVGITISIADIIKQMHKTVMDDDPAYETIPDSRDKVNNLFTMYSMSGDPDDFSSLVDYNYETALITTLMRNVPTSEIKEIVEDTEQFISHNTTGNLNISITGMIVVLRDFINLVIQASFISITASILVIGLIVGLVFRRAIWGILAVIPLTSAVILNFGFMGILGIDLSHVTAILSSIIIGVGVDFAIHYISQYKRLASHGADLKDISKLVVDDAGYPIILDAGSNMAFGALIFSFFIPIQQMGGLMVFAMLSTSIGTLTILASLTELMKNRLINHRKDF